MQRLIDVFTLGYFTSTLISILTLTTGLMLYVYAPHQLGVNCLLDRPFCNNLGIDAPVAPCSYLELYADLSVMPQILIFLKILASIMLFIALILRMAPYVLWVLPFSFRTNGSRFSTVAYLLGIWWYKCLICIYRLRILLG